MKGNGRRVVARSTTDAYSTTVTTNDLIRVRCVALTVAVPT